MGTYVRTQAIDHAVGEHGSVSLGVTEGDVQARGIPGGEAHGKPRVFMSHGVSDDILPINQCGRPVAAELRKRGYDVTFREFAGKHEVPPDVAAEGFKWIAGR